MFLVDVIKSLDIQDEDAAIYAVKPWGLLSEAIVEIEPEDGQLPLAAKDINAEYFLEIFLIRDFLEGWLVNLGYNPSIEEQCNRLIQYAEKDA